MNMLDALSAAQEVIGRRWREDQPLEKERILGLARDALLFVSETGQTHEFEDFRASNHTGLPQEGASPLEELIRKTEAFFTGLLVDAEAGPQGERELIQLIIDILRFIVLSRQSEVFGHYLCYLEADGPPLIVESFETLEEAQTWLRNHLRPPDFARILVAGTYHDVVYDDQRNRRWLAARRSLQHHAAELKLNEPTAAFATREEADKWLRVQPASVKLAQVLIGEVPHLAVYHFKLGRRVFYPLAPAQRG
jgi:hypothetical protein